MDISLQKPFIPPIPLNVKSSAFFLDINKAPSWLHGKTFYEYYDYKDIIQLLHHPLVIQKLPRWKYEKLQLYSMRYDIKTKCTSIVNRHSDKKKNIFGIDGRLFAINWEGATSMDKEIRHYLFDTNMIDIDAYFGHGSIIANKACLDGLKLPALLYVIENRQFIIDKLIISKELNDSGAKQLINSILFSRDINQWRCDNMYCGILPKELICLQREMCLLYDYIKKINHHIVIDNKIKLSSLLTRICEVQETIFLEHIVEYCCIIGIINKNYPILSLQHDGLMILKNSKLNANFLNNLNEYIYNKTLYRMTYRFKAMQDGKIFIK